ncbi:MAG: cardiolipin synthase [Erysipelotrichales bacterium]
MLRIVTLVFWAIIQLVLLCYLAFVPMYSTIIYPLIIILGVFLALIVLSDNSKLSTSKLSWITIILAIPVIGALLYIIFGIGHMSNYRKRILDNSKMRFDENCIYRAKNENVNVKQQALVDYLDHMDFSTTQMHYSGEIDTYTCGTVKYEQMFKDIENAKTYIHLEYYIIKSGQLFDKFIPLLIKKVSEGVEVRILVDFLGARTISKNTLKELRDNGVQIEYFNEMKVTILSKFSNFRDHRKIAVIDGNIAYTGGFNIGDEYIDLDPYYKHWEDFHIRISDSSAVQEYETLFAQSWFFETNENLFKEKYYPSFDLDKMGRETLIYPYGDGPDSIETFVRDMFVIAIMSAQKSICISTPYFIPDTVLYDAIIMKAQSGIDITLVTPGLPDKKIVKIATESYYYDLLKAGVKIHEYNGFVHAKKLLIDDDTAIVGTANFDMRSFNLSFEVCTLLLNGSVIQKIEDNFKEEVLDSKEISLEDVENVSVFKALLQVILKILAPLF